MKIAIYEKLILFEIDKEVKLNNLLRVTAILNIGTPSQ